METGPESSFDNITKLAASLVGTDNAYISFFDDEKTFVKSAYGFERSSLPADDTFCRHLLGHKEPVVLNDIRSTPPFHHVPMSKAPFNFRFYVGCPINSPEGMTLGALCIFSSELKHVTKRQIAAVQLLADSVQNLLELRKNNFEHQKLHRHLIDFQKAAQVGGWELNIKTSQTYWTDQIYKIYGLDSNLRLSKFESLAFYAEHERPRLYKMIQDCILYQTSFDGEFEFIDAKEHKKWVRVQAYPSCDERGEVVSLYVVMQDITEAKNRALDFEKNKEFLNVTLNNLPAIFYVKDHNGRYVMTNEKWRSSFGYENHEVIGKNDVELFGKPFAEQNIQSDQKVFQTGTTIELEENITANDHKKKIFRSFKFPYFNDQGEVYRVGAISMDISEMRKLQNQSLHNAKLVSIGKMSAGIGHEINNPLSIVMGYLDRITKAYASGNSDEIDIVANLEKVRLASKRISSIVNGLRSFSRVENEEESEFEIIDVVNETLYMVQSIYENDGISLVLQDKTTSSLYFCLGFRGKIQQVLVNLLANAKDAVKNVPAPQISVCIYSNKENRLTIEVIDNGCGIPLDEQEHLFDPFFTTKEVNYGTGLGLSLAHNIVNDHKGTLKFNSKINEGTCFLIELPAVMRDSHGTRTGNFADELSMSSRSAARIPELENKKFMVIDDEDSIREFICEEIEDLGGKAKSFSNGLDALNELSKKTEYDFIICDLRMPIMDGPDFLIKMLELHIKRPKFIFITGGVNFNFGQSEEKYMEKVDGFLYKPFESEQLIQMLISLTKKNLDIKESA